MWQSFIIKLTRVFQTIDWRKMNRCKGLDKGKKHISCCPVLVNVRYFNSFKYMKWYYVMGSNFGTYSLFCEVVRSFSFFKNIDTTSSTFQVYSNYSTQALWGLFHQLSSNMMTSWKKITRSQVQTSLQN